MRTSKIAVGLCCACAATWLCASAALAATELLPKGGKVTLKGGEALIEAEGESVACASSSGSGEVATVEEVKATVTLESCKAIIGTSKEASAAKVTSCHLTLHATTVAITEGCTVESSLCVLKLASAEAHTGDGFATTKEEEGSPASEIFIYASAITDTASEFCKALGVKGGKVGALELTLQGQGVRADPPRVIDINGATGTSEKEFFQKTENAAPAFEFLNADRVATGKEIFCEGMKAKAKTPDKAKPIRDLETPVWTNCRSNVRGGIGESTTVTASAACRYMVAVFAGAGPSFDGVTGWFPMGGTCTITATIVGTGCTITLPGQVPTWSSTLENKALNQVEVKEGTRSRTIERFSTSGEGAAECTTSIPANGGMYDYTAGSLLQAQGTELKIL